MQLSDLKKYKKVQNIAKETMQFLSTYIKVGLSAQDIKKAAEDYMKSKGIKSFWYYDVGALVFVSEETTISISGKHYQASNAKVQINDLVTVDLSPEINSYWGDYARSFIVQNGRVVVAKAVTAATSAKFIEGINVETQLHQQLLSLVTKNTSFAEVYIKMNEQINKFGFVNLDFNKNLGHSIAKHKDGRIYIEAGNQHTFKEIDLFTFEPHIKKSNSNYGFKHEDIYYFENSKLKVL